MKDTMILKNGTIIELEVGASLGALQVATESRTAMLETWEQLTPDNLASVQVKNGDGLVIGNYSDLVLASETSVVASDGTVLTTYNMREKSDTEKRLDALEEEQEVQNGAIGDLGEATSMIAEQMGGMA